MFLMLMHSQKCLIKLEYFNNFYNGTNLYNLFNFLILMLFLFRQPLSTLQYNGGVQTFMVVLRMKE